MPEVAERIAARYGLPARQIAERLARGRFRVKAGVERRAAETIAADLEGMGAVCSVVRELGVAGTPPPERPLPARAPERPRSALGDVDAPGVRAPGSPLAGAEAAPRAPRPATGLAAAGDAGRSSRPVETTGLAAAFAESGPQDLGALAADAPALSLATVDGAAEPGPASPLPASMPGEDPAAFLPPQALAEEPELALVEDIAPPRRAAEPAAENPALAAPFTDAAPHLASVPPAAAATATEPLHRRWRRALGRQARVRLAAGVLLAVVLGFVPAHVVAAVQEGSYTRIDRQVETEQARVETLAEWEGLDAFRAGQLSAKESAQTRIAVTALLVWAAAGAGLGFVWFRKIDWDRLAGD